MLKHFVFLGILLFFWQGLLAQNGNLSGRATDIASGDAIPYATIMASGTSYGTTSDEAGNFSLSLPAGTYNIVFTSIGYLPDTLKAINIIADRTTTVMFRPNAETTILEGVEVGGTRVTNTETAVVVEMRKSESIVNTISSQQIGKTQDRFASDVIKRVPGVTITAGSFVMIRGLSERYNSVMLNGALTPGSEVDKRAFSFDAIPSGALDRVVIYKTATADLPGDFAGGVIKLYTRSLTDSNQLQIGLSASYRTGSTFKDFYHGGFNASDVTGTGANVRWLPDNFPANLDQVKNDEQRTSLAKQLPNNWSTNKIMNIPDLRFNFLSSQNYRMRKGRGNNITAISYSNTFRSFTAKNFSYNVFDTSLMASDKVYAYTDDNFQNTARLSIMENWTGNFGKGQKLSLRYFYNQVGTNIATLRTGENFEENSEVRDYSYRYFSRSISTAQLAGNHEINGEKHHLSWLLGFSNVASKEPDFRRVRTRRTIGDTTALFNAIISPAASTLDAGRFFSDLHELNLTSAADYSHEFYNKNKAKSILTLKTGFYYEYRNRDFAARWMSYKKARISQFDNGLLTLPLEDIFAPEHINQTDGFELDEGTNPSDQYAASNNLAAGYVSLKIPAGVKWSFVPGLRIEHNIQQLDSRTFSDRPVTVNNTITSILPSLNVAHFINEKQQLRLAYYRTVNRPEFRELAPFSFYDFQYNWNIYGNEALLTPDIHNADLRWEYYPSSGEIISAAIFYKHFFRPIEMFFVPGGGGGGTKDFTFGNAEFSRSLGAEVELRKSFFFGGENQDKGSLTVLLNAAYIYSQVELGTMAVGQSDKRPMMGQSPFIVNAGLFYELRREQLQFNLLYNAIGKRIFAVGTAVNPDIYEMPRHVLDFTVSKGFGRHWELRLGVQDMLNSRFRLIQDSDGDSKINNIDEDILNYREGVYFTLGAVWKL
ncbi:MAG: carboxypeptidase regulatory-like domain-containing protein [Chitinophagales bacterium]|nr:carboxypeptidase regulatory-like domain-containing protein [Chitinophagales bacterium]